MPALHCHTMEIVHSAQALNWMRVMLATVVPAPHQRRAVPSRPRQQQSTEAMAREQASTTARRRRRRRRQKMTAIAISQGCFTAERTE